MDSHNHSMSLLEEGARPRDYRIAFEGAIWQLLSWKIIGTWKCKAHKNSGWPKHVWSRQIWTTETKASQVLLSRRVGVVVAVADAEDAPAADAPDVDVPAADAPAADAPCQAACQPLVTQDVILAVPLGTTHNRVLFKFARPVPVSYSKI